jgi:hypothetical protein
LNDVLVVESDIERAQVSQAAYEQPGADEQEERERDLRDDKRFVKRQPRPARASAGLIF